MELPNYTFYKDAYHGNQIAEADFIRLSSRAEAYINNIGCDLSSLPTDVLNMSICAVAEAWQTNEHGGDISSQSVGSWSKTYVQKKSKSDSQRLIEAASLYLGKYCNLVVTWI